jgi:hypothetical protein
MSNCILFNERITMAVTREDDFVSRAAGEWRNSSCYPMKNTLIITVLSNRSRKKHSKTKYQQRFFKSIDN